jgi:hypothetical protein
MRVSERGETHNAEPNTHYLFFIHLIDPNRGRSEYRHRCTAVVLNIRVWMAPLSLYCSKHED